MNRLTDRNRLAGRNHLAGGALFGVAITLSLAGCSKPASETASANTSATTVQGTPLSAAPAKPSAAETSSGTNGVQSDAAGAADKNAPSGKSGVGSSIILDAGDASGPSVTPPRPVYDPTKEYSTDDVDLGKAPISADGYRKLGFGVLAGYEYWPYSADNDDPNGALPSEIPAEVKALDGTKSIIGGYMVPIEIRSGRVRSFLLVRNQLACCFGMPTSPNEWIDVRMGEGKATKYIADVPIAVKGVLEVGEQKTADGVVLSIYRMEATDVHILGGF